MAYVKQTWIDGTSIANAERLNHIEDGIESAAQLSEKNILTASLTSNFSLTSTHTYQKLPITQYLKIGTKLSVNNSNQIVIGSGVNHIKVNYNVRFASGSTSEGKYAGIFNGTTNVLRTDNSMSASVTMQNIGSSAILSVNEGDLITLQIYGTTGDAVGGNSTVLVTWITIEVID